ncbi:MAG TPA: hypothetical protein VF278_08415 [Pirellulales bacterium]
MDIALYRCDREFIANLPAILRDGGFDFQLMSAERDGDNIVSFNGVIRDGRARIFVSGGAPATDNTPDNIGFCLYAGQSIWNLLRFPCRHVALGARVERYLLSLAGDRVEVMLYKLQEQYAERCGGELPP